MEKTPPTQPMDDIPSPGEPSSDRRLFEHLVWMSLADGEITPREEALLEEWRKALSFSREQQFEIARAIASGYQPPPPDTREEAITLFLHILEVGASDNIESAESEFLRMLAQRFGIEAEEAERLVREFREFGQGQV